MKEEQSLTPEEVAQILQITKHTVYEMVKRGELRAYRIGRKIRIEQSDLEAYKRGKKEIESSLVKSPYGNYQNETIKAAARIPLEPALEHQGLVICGQDILLDVLGRHLENHPRGCRAFRYNTGSFSGLSLLYHGKAHMSATHLWDSDSQSYNVPYVRRMLPGIPALLIHLASRMQGFYVAAGNPQNIKTWEDLTRPELRFINREPGSGTRVLLDEHLRLLKFDRRLLNGYLWEEPSHLSVASAVARGAADFALGNEKGALQVRGIDFVPLQKERYELAVRKEDMELPQFQTILDILNSTGFKAELEGLGDYDLSETGRIVAEL
ncbi:MAG: helix-turn-helix transcriptional regulator [Syntrophomonas sp.]